MSRVILDWRRLIYRFVGAAVLLSVVISLLLPNWYAARSTFLPPQETDTQGSMLQLFSKIGMEIGGAGLFSDTPVSDMMIGVLKSRRLREQLVDRFDLTEVYGARSREHAIRDLEDLVFVNSTAEGLIELRIEDKDRERAAEMTNAFVGLLDTYNRESSVEQAKRTSDFIRRYLDENQARLEAAAEELQTFQKEHGAIELTEQTRVTVEAAAQLQAEKTRLEIQNGILANNAGPGQMQRIEIAARLEEVDDKLASLVGANSGGGVTGVFLPLAEIPDLGFELAKLTREVLVQEKVYEYLAAQYEQSRIQEAKDLQTLRIVDRAVPPLKKSRPRRSLIVILTVLLSGVAAVGLAFACDGALEKEKLLAGKESILRSPEIRLVLRITRRLGRWSGVK